MTRFARAQGSKSSNERKPEEATSWLEMKNAMLSNSSNPTERIILKREEKVDAPNQTEWASLGGSLGDDSSLLGQHLKKRSKKTNDATNTENIKKKKVKKNASVNGLAEESKPPSGDVNGVGKEMKKKKAKTSKLESKVSEELDVDLEKSNVGRKKGKKRSAEVNIDEIEKPSGKKKKKKEVASASGDSLNVETKGKKKKDVVSVSSDCINVEVKGKKVKGKQNKKSKDSGSSQPVREGKKIRKAKAAKKENLEESSERSWGQDAKFNSESSGDKFEGQSNGRFRERRHFGKDGGRFGERNSRDSSNVEEIIVNGEKIPIVKFQGFYVTQEDAERLKKLRKEMINEGIPKQKLEAAIKLERRRAEKALSRLKKSVCFHCRKSGHLLSSCPSLGEKQDTSTGICYKCGSTEHSALECKVVKGTNYQFAECFICNEQGHIARQCPDNPRGLYPRGGACRECGDVTHLRKDCPQAVTDKSEKVITVGIRNDRELECLDEEIAKREKENSKTKVKCNKRVKF